MKRCWLLAIFFLGFGPLCLWWIHGAHVTTTALRTGSRSSRAESGGAAGNTNFLATRSGSGSLRTGTEPSSTKAHRMRLDQRRLRQKITSVRANFDYLSDEFDLGMAQLNAARSNLRRYEAGSVQDPYLVKQARLQITEQQNSLFTCMRRAVEERFTLQRLLKKQEISSRSKSLSQDTL